MKNIPLLVTFLLAATYIAGCNQEPTTTQQIADVKAETRQAAQDLQDYAFAQKAEFVKNMQGQLAALDKNLDELAAKIESASDAVKAEAKPKLQALREQAAQLTKQLAEATNANESTWDSVKAGTKKAYASLEQSFTEARQWASEKIAP